jgi:hypothetical protein
VTAGLRAVVRRALTTTPAAGIPAGLIHGPCQSDAGGHRFDMCCALCTRDVDALVEAVADAVQPLTAFADEPEPP